MPSGCFRTSTHTHTLLRLVTPSLRKKWKTISLVNRQERKKKLDSSNERRREKTLKKCQVSVWATRMTNMSSFGDAKFECLVDNGGCHQLNRRPKPNL